MRYTRGLLAKLGTENVDSGVSDAAINTGIVGTGVAAPFMGLIGEKKITQDPYYNANVKRMDAKALEAMARPGDVILTSTREGAGFYKKPQLALTGSEFYHAEPVITKKPRGAVTMEAGLYHPSKSPRFKNETPESILEKGKGTPMSKRVNNLRPAVYEDAVLMRPKAEMTPKQIEDFRKALAAGGQKQYSGSLAVKAYLKDLFVPKIKGLTSIDAPSVLDCKGEMCSSLPGGAYESVTGSKVAPGKSSRSVLPADFLRADSPYEAVGASLKHQDAVAKSPGRMLARRLAFRGGVGAGLAGAGLLAYNEPEALPALAVGAAAPEGARRLMDYFTYETPDKHPKGSLRRKVHTRLHELAHKHDVDEVLPKFPKMMGALDDHLELVRSAKAQGQKHVMTPEMKKLVKNFIRTKGGIAAGAGLGTYGLVKLLTNSLKNKEEQAAEA